jgi:hypothetical protein
LGICGRELSQELEIPKNDLDWNPLVQNSKHPNERKEAVSG